MLALGADFEAEGFHPFTIVILWKYWTLHRRLYTKRGRIIENTYLNCRKFLIYSR